MAKIWATRGVVILDRSGRNMSRTAARRPSKPSTRRIFRPAIGTLQDVSDHSGLAGISGLSLDTRILIDAAAKGDGRAQFALDLYYYRMAQCIGGLLAMMNGADALSFTGPIGQHTPS